MSTTQLERTADSMRKQASLKGPSYFLREAYCSGSCTCQWWHSSKTQLQYQSHRCVDPARWLQNNHESLDGKNQRLMHVKTVQTPHLAHHHPVVRYQASPIPPEPFELTSLIRERCTMASGTGSSSIHIFNTQIPSKLCCVGSSSELAGPLWLSQRPSTPKHHYPKTVSNSQ